ncbi:hypothetical protein B0I37DRAFT_384025 [Chaetomium sp. MPI-CAGE-AT-0009]|nr:hypothetical protein B0I37DRAFT_384025 [Chaetomium sp. MPI-CAGE-AT-0009]
MRFLNPTTYHKMPAHTHRPDPSAVAAARGIRKRLFVFCDGTWQDGVNKTRPLTNVATLARCLESVDSDGCLQIVYYDSGVGTVSSVPAQLVDGATGRGISAKIRNAYSFLSHNWNFREGRDEIILVGFSRGAFAVQCLAAFISDAGLLQKQHLYYLRGLFTLWANQKSPRGGEKFKEDRIKLQDARLLHQVNITACAVWDTVSSLGSIVQLPPRPLAFVGKDVPRCVQHAFQALALDEERSKFQPVVWQSKPTMASVSQCWFLGSHADVGGNGDAGLGALSLLWMVGKLHGEVGVAFDDKEIAKHLKHRFLEWGFTVRKLSWAIKETKRAVAMMPQSGQPTRHAWYWWLLRHETRSGYLAHPESVPTYIHFTARLAMAQKRNSCRPLRSWTTLWTEQNSGLPKVQWRSRGGGQTLDEHPLREHDKEYEILRKWCNGEFRFLDTDRGPFAAIEAPMTARELRGMAQFFKDYMKFENNKLSEGAMYSG